jgi:hypothetical protein
MASTAVETARKTIPLDNGERGDPRPLPKSRASLASEVGSAADDLRLQSQRCVLSCVGPPFMREPLSRAEQNEYGIPRYPFGILCMTDLDGCVGRRQENRQTRGGPDWFKA